MASKHTIHIEVNDFWFDHLNKLAKQNYGFKSRLIRSLLKRFCKESDEIYLKLGKCTCVKRTVGMCVSCAAVSRLAAGEDFLSVLNDYEKAK